MKQISSIMIVDAQGGGLGRQLVTAVKKELPGLHVIAVGTNTAATAAMLKAGADEAATGENAVIVVCRRADVIIGPIGMVIADSMLGEITPKMAAAVAQADARRILIPFSNCDNIIVGVADYSMTGLLSEALEELKKLIDVDPS